jgi:hypothetical protein
MLASSTPPWVSVAVDDPDVSVVGSVTSGADVHVEVTSEGASVFEGPAAVNGDYYEAAITLAPGRDTITVTAALGGGSGSATFETRYEPDAMVEFAFLTRVSVSEVVADYAQWLTGEEAAQAAYEDGVIDSVEEGVPNDFYIRNANPLLRTLPLAPDVVVWLQTSAGGPVQPVQVGVADWLALFNDGTPWGEGERPPVEPPGFGFYGAGSVGTPYWLVILDSQVIAIEQQYLP